MKKIIYLAVFICVANFANSQCAQTLSYDTSICSGSFSKTFDASILDTNLCSDSVTIFFNATGTSLAGDTNVYFHSAPQFVPFESWRDNYTVGNWGQNDGVGRMTSLGNNNWSITVQPRTYYNYPLDSCLNGIWMVFRNFNGTVQEPLSGAANNDFLYTVPTPPTSVDTGVSGAKINGRVTYLWSDNNTSPVRTFTSAVNLTVTATSVGGCTATGSVVIKTAHAPVTLGNDVIRCNPNLPVTLNAGSGFTTYIWLNNSPNINSTYTATNPGCYWITAIDSANCTSTAEVQIENSEVNNLSIPDSLSSCPGGHVTVNAATNVNLHGDSIIIIYNATAAISGLTGATKVYFHSGPQFTPSQGWQGTYTVGDYGLDDGVGEMTSLGNNLWRIAIDPYCYYKINPDTLLTGLWMIFRNADGTLTGKSATDGNIYVPITNGIPSSTFSGVTASRTARLPLTYSWSNNVTGPVNTFTTANTYTVTLSDNNSCTKSQSVVVSFTTPAPINLGADTTVCAGAMVNLSAPAGYAHYSWSNTDTTQSIIVATTSDYSVTTTDSIGCVATGSRDVTVGIHVVSLGNDIVRCSTAPVTLTASSGFVDYYWFGTGTSSNTYSAVNEGSYWVKAIDNSNCMSYDTVTVTNTDVLNLNLTDTLSTCTGSFVSTDASVNINAKGDSLIITYDATKGVTGLVGAAKVYMHSGPQFTPSQGWAGAYTVGNFGLDDGIGEMHSVGSSLWQIVIDPVNYYNVPPDSLITGVWMVFRNADGTSTGKSASDSNILLQLPSGLPPVSAFNGVTGSRKAATSTLTYDWSNTVTTPIDRFSTGGVYYVTVSQNSCSQTDSTLVIAGAALVINLTPDTSVCTTSLFTLQVDTGYASYTWSTGASTPYLYVTSSGTYYLTVSNTAGCSTVDSSSVILGYSPVVGLVKDTALCGNPDITLQVAAGFTTYAWSNDSTTSYINITIPGTYSVTVSNGSGCTSADTVVVALGQAPVFYFGADTTLCNVTSIELEADTGYASYLWNTSATTSHIFARTPNTYSVTVTISGGCTGSATIDVKACQEVGCGSPDAKFIVLSIDPGNTVTFEDSSRIAKTMSYEWNFGDGVTSADTGSIVHTYDSPGVYEVSLIIRDSCGGVSADSMKVYVNVTGIPVISGLTSFNIYPNPSTGNFNVQITLQQPLSVSMLLINTLGQTAWQKEQDLSAGTTLLTMDGSNMAAGIYTLELISNSERAIKKLTLTK